MKNKGAMAGKSKLQNNQNGGNNQNG